MMAAACATEAVLLRCPRCGHSLAMWLHESQDWQPLGARIKRRKSDRGRTSLVCPICDAMRRIPDDQEPEESSA
jgi:RNase P subunit RPR2